MAVIDSNILIDYLSGVTAAKTELNRHKQASISIVSWMEVMSGAITDAEEQIAKEFLRQFELLTISGDIAQEAVTLRKRRKIKLPDAVIWATAIVHKTILVTRNTKDFPKNDPSIRVPYK